MIKYAQIENSKTKQCSVGLGTNIAFYQSIGMTEMDVEQAYNGSWYITGFCPQQPPKTYTEMRQSEYPTIAEQLDMLYRDKINNSNHWIETITEIKTKYPKE